MLARAVAAECGASFLAINPSSVASKWLGDGVQYVQAAFSLARKLAPCVLFLDEVDALLSRRNSHNEHESLREMKNEAMAQWDGIRQGVITLNTDTSSKDFSHSCQNICHLGMLTFFLLEIGAGLGLYCSVQ